MKTRLILISLAMLATLLTGCSSKTAQEAPQESEHQHVWTDATCSAPKTCSVCDATEGEPIEHTWADATCAAPKTCSVCDITEGESLEHTWEVMDGAMICSVCGEVDETAVVEAMTLSGVPIMDSVSAESYLNIFNQNNVQNHATFLEKDGWIYGQARGENGKPIFVKVRTDYSDWTVLDSGYVQCINIVDNYIYYMLLDDNDYGIYKMRTSGSGRQLVVKVQGSMQIADGQIYYASWDYESETDAAGNPIKVLPEYSHLYRCELDGSNVTEIIAKPTFHFYVFNDGILYQDDNDNSSLHICDLDGTNDIKLNDSASYYPLYDGEYIYYVHEAILGDAKSRSIWKVKPDGSADQLVANYEVSSGMLMSYDGIFFVYGADSDRIYRVNKDGSGIMLITQDIHAERIQLFYNYLKYTKCTDDYKYIEGNYFCDYDGSGKWDFLDMSY